MDDFIEISEDVETYIAQAKAAISRGASGEEQAQIVLQKAQTSFQEATQEQNRLAGTEKTTAETTLRRLQAEISTLQQKQAEVTVGATYTSGPNKTLAEANAYLSDTKQKMDETNEIAVTVKTALGQHNTQMTAISAQTENITSNTEKANLLTKEMHRREKMVNIILYSVDGLLIALDCLAFWLFHHNTK